MLSLYAKCPYYVVLYMQSVLICSALYAKCSYYVVLYMQSVLIIQCFLYTQSVLVIWFFICISKRTLRYDR